MVTASHNPMDYSGIKLLHQGAKPISDDTGLGDIEKLAESGLFGSFGSAGSVQMDLDKSAYVEYLFIYIDSLVLSPLKIVVNEGNGDTGIVIEELAQHLPFELIRIHHELGGSFLFRPFPRKDSFGKARKAARFLHRAC
jgi:phosphomannomutase